MPNFFIKVSSPESTTFRITYPKKIVKVLPFTTRKRLPREILIKEVGLAESRKINRIYRRKNNPTNVLSFRYGPDYGEILVCPGVIRREARAQGNSYKFQMTWMIIHGMLHLAGVHHEDSSATAKRVAYLEHKILKGLDGKKAQSTKSKAQIKSKSTEHK